MVIKHNKLYLDFKFPKEALDSWIKSEINIFAKSCGEVFATLANIDRSELRKDDSNLKVLPVGEILKNGSKEVISFAKDNKDGYFFPYLYPKGNQYIPNNKTARDMEVKRRMFSVDGRFRNCNDWFFFILTLWKNTKSIITTPG